jgi:predicted DCC family thiol-disulfide oxidoreductase YuxK
VKTDATAHVVKPDAPTPTRAGVGAGSGPVLLYDGECGLCRATVRFLLRRDRPGVLRYAALQGRFAQATLRRLGLPTEDFDSLVFLPVADGAVYWLRTEGVLAVLRTLGGFWAMLARIGGRVPPAWRDAAYRVVARWRHRLTGHGGPAPENEPAAAGRFIE